MKQFRIMTFNIRHGRGMDGVLDLDRIARVVEQAETDFVALNEVDRCTVRSNGVDQAEYLGQRLNMHWAYAPSITYQGGQYGNAILSRHPIVESIVHRLPNKGGEQRTALQARYAFGGQPFTLFVTHLSLGEEEQVAQVEALGHMLRDTAGPCIVAGDLNFDDCVTGYLRYLNVPMADAGKVADGTSDTSIAYTYPADKPAARIDYVLLSTELHVVEPFATVSTQVSDHLPVVGTVGFRKSH